MPFTTSTDLDGTVRITFSVAPTSTELVSAAQEAYVGRRFEHAIWDYRQVSVSSISVSDFGEILEASEVSAPNRGSTPKTAILCRSETDMLLAMAYVERAHITTRVTMAVFLSEEEAQHWLKEPISKAG